MQSHGSEEVLIQQSSLQSSWQLCDSFSPETAILGETKNVVNQAQPVMLGGAFSTTLTWGLPLAADRYKRHKGDECGLL